MSASGVTAKMKKLFCRSRSDNEAAKNNKFNELKSNEAYLHDLKEKSIRKNTRILREDLYQNYMKPYFTFG